MRVWTPEKKIFFSRNASYGIKYKVNRIFLTGTHGKDSWGKRMKPLLRKQGNEGTNARNF